METRCPKCGYVLEPFDKTCPKCARMAQTPCAVCGRKGVAATCEKCQKEVCAECATSPGPATICNACQHQDSPEAMAERAPVELAASAAAGYGFFDSMSRAFTFLKESVMMAFRDTDLILPAVFSAVANGVIIGVLMYILWRTGALAALGESKNEPLWFTALFAGVAFVSYIVSYFFIGMTVNLVDTHLHGRDAELGEAFADARKNFLALLGLAVLSTLVGIATGMLRSKRGRGLGDYAADAIDRVWLVATYLILPAIILEDLPLRAAANRARDLHRRNLVGIAVGEVGVIVLSNIIGSVGAVCAGALGFVIYTTLGAALIPAVVIAGLFLSVVISFSIYLRATYYTCLFLWAVATEKAGERTAAPAPLATSLGYGTAR